MTLIYVKKAFDKTNQMSIASTVTNQVIIKNRRKMESLFEKKLLNSIVYNDTLQTLIKNRFIESETKKAT